MIRFYKFFCDVTQFLPTNQQNWNATSTETIARVRKAIQAVENHRVLEHFTLRIARSGQFLFF
ncbi:hypothetical protein TTHERM_00085140 (macronuclear) [Tetrahymena thermophila SB210]|uniref:Uncharacterized protein n=1 Tax=Tetrahymena thermophila (strain SB210) TaxID=312017 RepID=Q236T4_TETTS|nr:hypothetical protein TTHERM_00085140 [Tetrahymena thermophila SB210]EAR92416.1 hypothetical protein TTHERM_00085140 [Tetrahymena thermophila SB210]|eukprot:XP_001012661.1 hypothetical protein TTHERM_00085140 [Tetrahymena thermophila SB210]